MNFLREVIKHFLRRGAEFRRQMAEMERIEKFSPGEIAEYQSEKLRHIIKLAWEQVPYYRRVFKERRLDYRDIRRAEDLAKLPVIDKKTVREHFKEFRNRNHRGFVFKGFTSGTTGTPGVFLRDLGSINCENAAIFLQLKWGGARPGDAKIRFRGDRVVPRNRDHPPFWAFHRVDHQLFLSSFHLSESHLPFYIKQIESFKPVCMQAYPSTAYILAKFLEKQGKFLDIPVVQLSSEPLYPEWYQVISHRLRANVFDHYGMAERVIFAGDCEKHTGLHLNPAYGVTEFIDPVSEEAKPGKGVLVGTTLHNALMPLIRYKTGDLSELVSGDCSCCRHWPRVKPVETRVESMIVAKNGRLISPVLFTVAFKVSRNILLSQIHQTASGDISIKIVKAAGFSSRDESQLLAGLKEVVGEDQPLRLDYVEDIPRGAGGKFPWVTSEIKTGQL